MSKVSVRYIVNDVDAVIPFYADMLGFEVEMHPAAGFASLSRGDLQLLPTDPVLVVLDNRWQITSFLLQVAGTESKLK